MKKVLFVAVLAMCMVGCCKKADNSKKCCEGEKKECCEKKACCEGEKKECCKEAEAPAEEVLVVEEPAAEAPAAE